ncbi:MAG: hypothetical protein GW949_02960 [Spirochaetales bacterium]|nr:hypothetical protein [Spirochaetales bacterium]
MMKTTKSKAHLFDELIRGNLEFRDEDFVLGSESEYAEVLNHIQEHKYYTNKTIPFEMSYPDAAYAWFEEVYEPVTLAIDTHRLVKAMPGSSRGELYLWVSRHWHFLKERMGQGVSADYAVLNFGRRFSRDIRHRTIFFLLEIKAYLRLKSIPST